MRRVPTYSANDHRIRDYSLDALLKLARMRKVYFRYSRSGRLLSAHFLPHDEPIRASAHMGQAYSFQVHVGDHKTWCHAAMFRLRDDAGQPLDVIETELFLRAVFRAVPLSCMQPDSPSGPASKVVSITTGRKSAARQSRARRAA